ncbi:MFS transporter [Arthrobacter halodurans]|uniref:MFS transporter n=1 Tax=Arthrobacter halodurans TaxID=516699 RepID=A0ABV4URI4_9MICC
MSNDDPRSPVDPAAGSRLADGPTPGHGAAAAAAARLWTPGFVLASVASGLVFFNAHLLLSTFAAQSISRFAVGDATGGLVASIFIVGALVSRVFAGPLMERFPHKAVFAACMAVFVAMPPLHLLIDSLGLTIAARILHGMAFGICSSVAATVAVSRIPRLRVGEGTSHYASSTVIGVAAGALVGLALSRALGFDAVLWLASATSLVSVLLLLAVPADPRAAEGVSTAPTGSAPDGPDAAPPARRGPWARLLEPAVLPIAAVGGLFTIGYASVVTYLGVFADERGLGPGVSFFFLAYAVAVLVSRPWTGPLMDRRGYNPVMLPAFAVFAAGLLLLATATSLPWLLAAAVLVGLGQGNLLSAAQTIAVTRVPRERIGMATSTFFLGIDAGMGFGPMLAGLLVQAHGPATTYLALGLFVLAVGGLYWVVQGRRLGA